MEHSVIPGELVTLRRVDEDSAALLHEHLSIRAFYKEIGRRHIPSLVELRDDLFDDLTLYVWQVHLTEEERMVGYAGFVAYSGPTYLFYFSLAPDVDYEVAQDCYQKLIPLFFRETDDAILYTYVEKPVPEQVDELLLEGGFDLLEGVPGVDEKETAVYAMERHTFEAYFGEDEEGEGELEF